MNDDTNNNGPSHDVSHNDMEQWLGQLTPKNLGEDMRPRVLAAVDDQLRIDRKARRFRWAAVAVAASIVMAVALNIGLCRISDQRLARIIGAHGVLRQGEQQPAFRLPARNETPTYEAYCRLLKQWIDESTVAFGGRREHTDGNLHRNRKDASDSTMTPDAAWQFAAELA